MESNKLIIELASVIVQSQTFEDKTVDQELRTAEIGPYYCSYNVATLEIYENNLSIDEQLVLRHELDTFFNTIHYSDREREKEIIERRVLNKFLLNGENPYRTYEIKKTHRPDFTLIGEKKIGVEVVKLTTNETENMLQIARATFGKGMTMDEVKDYAESKHKSTADALLYYDLDGNLALGLGAFDVDKRQEHYAQQLNLKYNKYKDNISDYDEFIILADGYSGVCPEISDEHDIDAIIKMLRIINPQIHNTTVTILWQNGSAKDMCSMISL